MVSHASRHSALPSDGSPSQRKWLSWLFLGSGCVGLLYWLISGLGDATRWPLKQLVISGELQQVSQQEIRQAVQALMPLKSFMMQEVKPIQQQLEALPWVAQASVRKQWPDQLTIRLWEHQAVACWRDQQLLNRQGRRFSAPIADKDRQQLPQFYAPKGYEQRLLTALPAMTAQVAQGGFKITSMMVDQHHAWRIVLNDQMLLLLGADQHDVRLQRFLVLYPLLIRQPAGVPSTVDLRYAHGAAISWVPLSKPPLPGNRIINE